MIDLAWLLSDKARIRVIGAGQRIAPPTGEKEMYILLSGQAGIYQMAGGQLAAAGILSPGDTFGARELFTEGASQAYLAQQECIVYPITQSSLPQLVQKKPEIALSLLRDACAEHTAVKPVVAAPAAPAASATSVAQAATNASASPRADEKSQPKPVAGAAPPADMGGASALALASDFFPEGHAGYPGVVKPEYTQFVYDKQYKCPCCYKTFNGKKTFESKLSIESPMRFDMREFFVDFSMPWYSVVTCPHCYFSALTNYFSEPKNFFRARVKDVAAELAGKVKIDFEAERDLDIVMANHYLALHCSVGYVAQRQISAKLWANLSWLYEDAQDSEMEKYAASRAAEAYANLYRETTLNPAQEQVICLTIGGMLYRANEMKEIKKWLFTVKSSREGKRMYADLADDLLALIKDNTEEE